MAEDKNSQPDQDPSTHRRSSSAPTSELAHDFFGRPDWDAEQTAAPPRNGIGNSFEARREFTASAAPAQIAVPQRDWSMRAAAAAILLALIALGVFARRESLEVRRAFARLQSAVAGLNRPPDTQQERALNRADVMLGGPDGVMAELATSEPATGAHTGASAVLLHFYNSGRTPARHFGAAAWSNARPGVPEVRYRQRFRNEATGEIVLDRMSPAEASVAAASPVVVALPDEWAPSSAFMEGLRAHPDRLFVVSGAFEYCDVFGEYHCGTFAVRYLGEPANRFVSWLTTPCRPAVPAPPPGIDAAGKAIRWIALDRCEHPGDPQ